MRWRAGFAAIAVVMLLTVQVGLSHHGASHLHPADESADCSQCVLGFQFAALPASVPALCEFPGVIAEISNPSVPVPDTVLPSTTARAPPVFPV